MGFNTLGKISVYHIHVLYEYVYILDAANAHLYVCFHSLHKKENNVFLFLSASTFRDCLLFVSFGNSFQFRNISIAAV